MTALSLIHKPAASEAYAYAYAHTLTLTHMLAFMRKHTLHINPLNLGPPKLQSLLSIFNRLLHLLMPALFTIFHAGASCLCQFCLAVIAWHLARLLLSLWWLTGCSMQALVSVWWWCHTEQQWHLSCSWKGLLLARPQASKQQRVLKGGEKCRPTGQMLSTLWLRGDRARDRATVRAWPQHQTPKTYSTCHGYVVLKRMSFSFKIRPQSVKHLHAE